MRTTKTLSVTLPPDMLTRAEQLAKKENPLRHYERQRWWDQMNAFGRVTAEAAGISTEEDVVNAIHAMRQEGPVRKKHRSK